MAGMSDRRKSTYSQGANTSCVAVGTSERGVLVEDTKQDNQVRRARLAVTAGTWREFVTRIKGGHKF